MSFFTNLVWQHQAPGGCVYVYGGHPIMKHHPTSMRRALHTAQHNGAQPNRISILQPAPAIDAPGYQQVQAAEYHTHAMQRQVTDGVVLTDYDSAAGIPVGDCLVLALIHPRRCVAVHGGRAALTPPSGCGGCTFNIVSMAYQHFSEPERAELHAVIACSIAPRYFAHADERGQELIQPFLDTYGADVFLDDPAEGKLDSVTLVRRQCEGYGTPADHIIWDELDTYSNPDLASHRQQTQAGVPEPQWQRNCVFVHHT